MTENSKKANDETSSFDITQHVHLGSNVEVAENLSPSPISSSSEIRYEDQIIHDHAAPMVH